MSDTKTDLAQRLKPRLKQIILLVVGLVLGAILFSGTDSQPEPAESQSAADADTTWTCSMHPQIRQSEPGSCPICGMDLIPVGAANSNSSPTQVVLSERAQALAKLRTTTVRRRTDASGQLRLLGRIEPDETTRKSITAWTGGRIDRLHVNTTGERVRAGQIIATLYSPEVFAAHQDLLVAKRQVDLMTQSPDSSRQAAAATLEAARERLRLLGVPDNELARMETEVRPTRAVAIRTPFSGTVIERLATEGAYVSTGTPLYRLANLKTLWVQLDAYESDLAKISLGDPVRVKVDALVGEDFEGKVAFIEPTVDARTRTALVRVAIDNKEDRLRPGMFAEATVATGAPAGEASPLVVPSTAPLFTGRRAIVYVELKTEDRTAYEARTVRLGPRLGDYYPVVAGLSEGERVVSRGAFAVDADLQIRGGASMMTNPDDSTTGGWDAVIQLAAAERKKLSPVMQSYLQIQSALAEDQLVEAKRGAESLIASLETVKLKRPKEAVTAWTDLAKGLGQHSHHIKMAEDLEGARAGFESLSLQVQSMLRRFGNPLDTPLNLAFCPMASGSQGASWIQQGIKIDNSYFGASMRTCGEVRHQVAPGEFLAPLANPSVTPSSHEGHQH